MPPEFWDSIKLAIGYIIVLAIIVGIISLHT